MCLAFVLTGWKRSAFPIPFTPHRTAGTSVTYTSQRHLRRRDLCEAFISSSNRKGSSAETPWHSSQAIPIPAHQCPRSPFTSRQIFSSGSLFLPTKPRTYLFPCEPQRNAQLTEKCSVVVSRAACGRSLRRLGLPAMTSLLTLLMAVSQELQKTRKRAGKWEQKTDYFLL